MSGSVMTRKGDPQQRKKVHDNLSQVSSLKAEYFSCKQKLKQAEEDLEHEREKLRRVNDTLIQMQDQLCDIEEEIDSDPLPEGAQPKSRLQRRDQLRMQISQLEAATQAQRAVTNSKVDNVNETERKLYIADRNLSQFVNSLEETEALIAIQEELDKERAQKLAELEVKRAKRWEREQKQSIDNRSSQIEELNELANTQIAAAQEFHVKATQKVADFAGISELVARKIKEKHEHDHQERTRAVIELKKDISTVRTELATQSDRQARKVAGALQALEDEKDSMVSKGLNPYAEFRRRELTTEARKLENRMKSDVEANKVSLSLRLAAEESIRSKEERKQRKDEEHEKRFRDSQGRKVVENKNKEYITSVTIGGKEILDPTGRVHRVDPSQIMEIKDGSFGLGKSARIPKEVGANIIEKMRGKLHAQPNNYGEYQRFVDAYLTPEEKEVRQSESSGGSRTRKNVSFESDGQKRSSSARQVERGGTNSEAGGDAETESERREALAALHDQEAKSKEFQKLANTRGTMPGITEAAKTVNISKEESSELIQICEEEVGSIDTGVIKERSPKYKPVALTTFEKKSFEEAKKRQKQRLEEGSTQVAGGKVFQGAAFVLKPSEILFKDFEVGKKYKKVFLLTNASYTFNSFKLLPLSDDILDFFTITYEKPGRMSAGVSCAIEVLFAPQINNDINSKLRLQTETGPVEIPLTCLKKKCSPQILNGEIDFGDVVIGQDISQTLRLENTEALASAFKLSRDVDFSDDVANESTSTVSIFDDQEISGSEDFSEAQDVLNSGEAALNESELSIRVRRVLTAIIRLKKKQHPFSLSFVEDEGYIDGYSKSSVGIICAPLTVGECVQRFTVAFEGVHEANCLNYHNLKRQTVTMRVRGVEVPVYVDDETVDMKCTLFKRIYRKRLEIRNRGVVSYRVNIKIPPPFNKYIEVNPQMIFIQNKSSQSINIKFSPTVDILDRLRYFSFPMEGFLNAALMTIPVKLEVVNQELPVYFILRSIVCPSDLELSASELDFGQLYVNQQSTIDLWVTNTSMQPQRVAFVRVPKEFQIQPNEGFATLLPNEKMCFQVSFCPLSAIRYQMKLTLQSSLNDTYVLNVTAVGIDSPISLSSSTLRLRTTGPGERVIESVFATNTSIKQQTFELFSPSSTFSWLKISPAVVELEPGASARIEIEYLPPADAVDLNAMIWHDNVSNAASGKSPFAEWSEDAHWFVGRGSLCEVQWAKPLKVLESNNDRGGEDGEDAGGGMEEDEVVEEGIPPDQWGILGTWRIPVFIKARNVRSASPRSRGERPRSPSPSGTASTGPFPLFLNIQTAVVIPQLEIDCRSVNFGQIALGTRQLKILMIRNLSNQAIQLLSSGLSALGPFTVLNHLRSIDAKEFRTIVVECLPTQPGLHVQVLELKPSGAIGGHQLRVTLKVEGMKPSISLEGLSPPPSNWNPKSGVLNFGNILCGDTAIQKFSISNKSQFAIEVNIFRSISSGLSPITSAPLIERTMTGLPLFSFKPEIVIISPGSVQQIEVYFRPDRGRFMPFREDVSVRVGQTDEILTVGFCGRSWPRQMFATPAVANDEAFFRCLETQPSAYVEDLLTASLNSNIRSTALVSRRAMQAISPQSPPIILEFPDPYAENATGFVDTDSQPQAATGKGGGGKGGNAAAATPAISGRSQTKKLIISSAKILDSRTSSAGSYEFAMAAATKESNYFTISPDKGPVAIGAEVSVDVTCTLPRPNGIGGLIVGSWKSYDVEVTLKGGWFPAGESDEVKIPVILKAFVSL